MMRSALLGLLSLFVFTNANADCMNSPDKQIEAKIDKISLPVYDAKGSEVKGCILHSNGKVLGYADEDRLCLSRVGSNIKVRLSYGCCDTGPDFGDAECVIRTKAPFGVGSTHGNGVAVHFAVVP